MNNPPKVSAAACPAFFANNPEQNPANDPNVVAPATFFSFITPTSSPSPSHPTDRKTTHTIQHPTDPTDPTRSIAITITSIQLPHLPLFSPSPPIFLVPRQRFGPPTHNAPIRILPTTLPSLIPPSKPPSSRPLRYDLYSIATPSPCIPIAHLPLPKPYLL